MYSWVIYFAYFHSLHAPKKIIFVSTKCFLYLWYMLTLYRLNIRAFLRPVVSFNSNLLLLILSTSLTHAFINFISVLDLGGRFKRIRFFWRWIDFAVVLEIERNGQACKSSLQFYLQEFQRLL